MEFIFILYKPAVPGNIGASARAIKTMGFHELRLIQPCDHLCDEARMLAHGSNDVLEKALVCENFKECTAGLDYIIGTTAKNRNTRMDYYSPDETKRILTKKAMSVSKIGVLFGTEESGLPNEILMKCDLVSTLPMKNPYPSLNLGQAVMVYAWELAGLKMKKKNIRPVRDEGYIGLKSRVSELLQVIGIPEGMPLHNRVMERFAVIADEDINLLHSITSKLKNILIKKNL